MQMSTGVYLAHVLQAAMQVAKCTVEAVVQVDIACSLQSVQ